MKGVLEVYKRSEYTIKGEFIEDIIDFMNKLTKDKNKKIDNVDVYRYDGSYKADIEVIDYDIGDFSEVQH